MNTSAEELAPDVREVLLTITLEAKQGDTTLYLVEVKQGGVFTIAGKAPSPEDMEAIDREASARAFWLPMRARSGLLWI